jgi:hypothetical protein
MTTASGFAAVRSVAPSLATPLAAIQQAAQLLLPDFERGRRIDVGILRTAMECLRPSDAAGAWDWKTAYDACEVTTVLFLRKYGKTLKADIDDPSWSVPVGKKCATADVQSLALRTLQKIHPIADRTLQVV